MRQFLTATLIFISSLSAFAGERIVTYNLYNNVYEMDSDDKEFTFFNFAIVNADKKVKYIESEYCGDDSISCNQRIVLEKEKVLQVTIQYHNGGSVFSDDSNYDYVEFNFPLNSMSEEDMTILKQNSGMWDLTGKKLKTRIKLAKKRYNINLKSLKKIIDAVDYQNSRFCDMDERPWCQEDIRYVKKEITVQHLSVTPKI